MKGEEDMIHASREVKEEMEYARRQLIEFNKRLDQVESSCRTIDLQLGQIMESSRNCKESGEMHCDMSLSDEKEIFQQEVIEDS